ncbi:MAG: cation:proton antiporter [bacterium]
MILFCRRACYPEDGKQIMTLPLLKDIVIIMALSIGVLFLFSRLRLPAIVGFLMTGLLAGPFGLQWVSAIYEVEILAEIGVVLLLFTIGIEFSLNNLLQIRKTVLLGGTLQVVLTVLAGLAVAHGAGRPLGQSLFVGFLISLSSTAIVLRLIQERAEVDSPHGRTMLGILIFQDVVVVPMMLLTPLLGGVQGSSMVPLALLLARGLGVVVLVLLGSKWVVPTILHQIVRTRSRELFMLSILVMCFSIAWLTSSIGLSLALGAFLAGLTISESEYSRQALTLILPFKDVFSSFFFISIGMLLDMGFLLEQWQVIALLTGGVLGLKAFLAALATLSLGFPVRTSVLAGLGLCQIGEFAFVLSKTGLEHGLLPGSSYQLFLSVSVITMAATPFVVTLAPRVADLVTRLVMPRRLRARGAAERAPVQPGLKDHLVVVGFGINGRNLARAAKVAGIPYIILEINSETVRRQKTLGVPIYYGDATQEAVLEHVNVQGARVVVVAISDPAAARSIIETVRRLNPLACIIVRIRYILEMKPLYELGASEVIPEEFETSMEIFSRVLRKYLVPRGEIEKLTAEIRADGYETFRKPSSEPVSLSEVVPHLQNTEIATFRVGEGSEAAGRSLAGLELRRKHGVILLAIQRDSETVATPGADTRLHAGDVLVLIGAPEKMAGAAGLFRRPTHL